MDKTLQLLPQQVSKHLRHFRLFLLTLLLCGYMQTMAETWTDSNGMTWSFTVNGTEATDIRPAMYEYERIYIYGDPNNPEQGPVTLDPGDAADGRFSSSEGNYFPTISDEVYYGFKTLIFEITETTEGPHIWNSEEVGTTMRVMNGWWSTVYADDVPMSVGLWELPITEAIANDCALGGLGRDLNLLMMSGSITIKSVFYQTQHLKVPDVVVIPAKVYAGSTELTVTSIGDYAFQATRLASVTIPEGVTRIGDYAFYGCTHLTSVSIPEGVTSLGDWAFTYCFGLASVTIPSSVTSIGDYTFSICSSLTSVSIHEGVMSIGNYAFSGCDNLTSVTIPEGVTSLGDRAFYGCFGLASVTIPSSVTSIGSGVFRSCYGLTNVIIPEGVTSIGEGAFEGCSYLTSVTSLINDPFEIDSTVFISNWDDAIGQYVFTTATLYVPVGTKEKYEATAGWNLFKNIVEMAPTGIAIDEVNFPDENFRQYVKDNCDADKDGYLSGEEIAKVSKMDIHNKEIANLKGIEYFTALTYLNCTGNNLSVLDMTKNTALKELICLTNKITKLDISNNLSLTDLNCNVNRLTELDLSKNVALQTLRCMQNQLTTLDVRNNLELKELIFGENQISQIDVSNNLQIWLLSCENNLLNSLDISKNTVLEELDCSRNQLSTLDLTNNSALKKLDCEDNQITNLNLSNHPELYGVWCNNNKLTTLDVSECSKLVTLYCPVNQLSGYEMDELISGLSENGGMLYAIKPDESNEQNKVTKYQVAAAKEKGWTVYYWNNEAYNWIEYEGSDPQEIAPVEQGEVIDIGTEIDSDTDLDGNVVGDVYYSISSGDGSYNAAEGCIVVTKPTDDSVIEGKDIFGEDFKDGFTGIVFKVKAGSGTVKVQAETQGTMTLKVKIGSGAPVEMELEGGKLKVSFPYSVTEDSYVYIYGGSKASGAKGMNRAPSDGDVLKIYGFEIVSDASGIEAVENGQQADAPVYNLNGQRVNSPGKGIYIKNGRKVLMK